MSSTEKIPALSCHVCGGEDVTELQGWSEFRQVTSDCRHWPRAPRLALCRKCGVLQKVLDETWHMDADAIYKAYEIYSQSGGSEQAVFDQQSGSASPRSARLMDGLAGHIKLPAKGRLLDIGCGNGAFLRIASGALTGWSLAGSEVSNKYQSLVESIPGVEALYTSSLDSIPGSFDVIMLIHVLEHIPSPVGFLTTILHKLNPGGVLFIEVPNHQQNPFELLIADHASHFSIDSLAGLVSRSGFESAFKSDSWVKKELTVIARKSGEKLSEEFPGGVEEAAAAEYLQTWLSDTVQEARQIAEKGVFGLFGASIAATWLYHELNGKVQFFVDEDPLRDGKFHLGVPIHAPSMAPEASHVFVGLPTPLAQSVAERLKSAPFKAYIPPPMELPATLE